LQEDVQHAIKHNMTIILMAIN